MARTHGLQRAMFDFVHDPRLYYSTAMVLPAWGLLVLFPGARLARTFSFAVMICLAIIYVLVLANSFVDGYAGALSPSDFSTLKGFSKVPPPGGWTGCNLVQSPCSPASAWQVGLACTHLIQFMALQLMSRYVVSHSSLATATSLLLCGCTTSCHRCTSGLGYHGTPSRTGFHVFSWSHASSSPWLEGF